MARWCVTMATIKHQQLHGGQTVPEKEPDCHWYGKLFSVIYLLCFRFYFHTCFANNNTSATAPTARIGVSTDGAYRCKHRPHATSATLIGGAACHSPRYQEHRCTSYPYKYNKRRRHARLCHLNLGRTPSPKHGKTTFWQNSCYFRVKLPLVL